MTSGQQEALKWLAITTMLIDHVGVILLPEWLWLRWVGRLAFPLFGLLIAYNIAVRGVPPARYLRPLAVFAAVSQPIYSWAFGTLQLNIFFTLFLGVALVWSLEASTLHNVLVLAGLAVLGPFVDYSYPGVLLILVFVMALGNRWFWPLAGVVVVALNIWLGYGAVVPLLLGPLVLAISKVPVTLERSSRWLFYGFYPLHLFLLKCAAVLLMAR